MLTGEIRPRFDRWAMSEMAKSRSLKLDMLSGRLRIWRFVEGNPVNDGVVFWIRAVAYDLAVKTLRDTPAGDVL